MSIDTVLLNDGTWGVRVYGNDVTCDEALDLSFELDNVAQDARYLNRQADRLTNYSAERAVRPRLTLAQVFKYQMTLIGQDLNRINQRMSRGTWT